MKENKKKVVLAMSGGIDSSVSAVLLREQGFEVVGAFMKFWAPRQGLGVNRCCSSEAEKRARLIAKKLGMPFYVFNFEKEFKKEVVDYAVKKEKAGLTPNPCVICNKEIKFGLLLKKALSLGANYIATGHYVQIKDGKLFKGEDENKDQSYFLWKLDKKILKYILFPVGGYNKKDIIKLAEKHGLPFKEVSESQDVCFDIKHGKNPGNIVNIENKVVGEHNGLWFYTIGQRKGIGLAGGPYYVLDKNIKKNQLMVTKNEKDLYTKELKVKEVNWLISDVRRPNKVKVKIRYGHKPVSAIFNGKKVIFTKPQRAVTSGQSAVFYSGKKNNQLIAGGIII
ncbi:tRNA 2-thiouridine(34) synthase MnmA [Patescibacteria group bacterium]|nr:tRNA 2-thiouridine(34) synthase MnmA [Patescibacteria group bacterium]